MTVRIDGTNSAANPAITGADADTGLQFGTDEVSIVTGGTDRVTVDSSGHVGIGETTPAAGLDVTVDTNPVLAIDRGSENTANFNLLYNGTLGGQVSAANGEFQISAVGASAPMRFFTNGSEGMRIDSSGNLGIGTTGPSTPLHVLSSTGTQLTLERTSSVSDYALQFTRGNKTEQGIYTDGAGISLRGVDASNGTTQVRLAGDNTNANSFDRIEFTVEGTVRARIDDAGLKFGTDTADTSALDDYEEGAFTPTYATGSGSFGSTTWGRYTKIGQKVFIHAHISISASDNTTNNFTIGGMPYTPTDPGAGGYSGSVMINKVTFATGNHTAIASYITEGTNGIRLYGLGSNLEWEAVHNVDVNANDNMYVSIAYDAA